MKKRIFNILLAIVLCVIGIINPRIEAKAEVVSEDIALSDILTDDALIGYAQNQTWGVYFSDGYSIVNKISSTKVGAGGATNAKVKCTVKVTAILERKDTDGLWARVTSWNQTNTNAYSVVSSKSVTVASGYYYRVRCYHYASTDTSSSFTDALWVGN